MSDDIDPDDPIVKQLQSYLDERMGMTPEEQNADLADQWRQMPDAVRRFAMSINRFVRVQNLNAPQSILDHELGILRPRITALRDYLDVLEESVKE